MIYLDNSATTLIKPDEVKEELLSALENFGNSSRGVHGFALNAARKIYETRLALAKLFNIEDPLNIAFVSNATEALNIAINSVVGKNDHIITTVCEHNSVLRPLYLKEKTGSQISFLPIDELGNVKIELLSDLYQKNTKAIIINHASNVTGNIVDLEKIKKFAKEHNLLLIVDAAQSAGIVDIDVKKLGIDILCFSGHKGLLGPQGVGGIYVASSLSLIPLKVGGSGIDSYSKHHPTLMPTLLEAGTLNAHGIAGLYGGLSYIEKVGRSNLHKKELSLAKKFYQGLKKESNLIFYGDYEAIDRLPIVSFNIKNIDSQLVSDILFEQYGICVRSGAHCAPLIHQALNTKDQGIVRFSFSHFNTDEEVEIAIKAVKELIEENA